MESKEKETEIKDGAKTDNTENVTKNIIEDKPVDGYHNPNDLKMIRSLQVALRQASDEIKGMAEENQQQRNDLAEKEELILQASSKLDEQDGLIKALELEKNEIIANKGSKKMQEEISKAIEFGNQIKSEAEEQGNKRRDEIISLAEEKAKAIISEAEKKAKLAEERAEKANNAFHEVTAEIQKYQDMFAAILSQKSGVPNPSVVELVKEENGAEEIDPKIKDKEKKNINDEREKEPESNGKGKPKDEGVAEGLWGTVPTSSQGSEKKLPDKPKAKSEAQMRLEKQLEK